MTIKFKIEFHCRNCGSVETEFKIDDIFVSASEDGIDIFDLDIFCPKCGVPYQYDFLQGSGRTLDID